MAALMGYAAAFGGWRRVDHTYAASDDGYVWPCWGGTSGGNPICWGYGDSATAHCLAQPDFSAGIEYCVTGVCHQTANRILCPAGWGVIVSAARGFGLSCLFFGTYGVGPWPELRKCGIFRSLSNPSPNGGPTGRVATHRGGTGMVDDGKWSEFSQRIAEIHSSLGPDDDRSSEELRHAELQALADAALERDYDQEKLRKVFALNDRFNAERERLAESLRVGAMTREQYLAEFAERSRRIAARCEDILGARDFEALFGIPASEAGEIVDSEVFLGASRRG
jgi:hypothetical protein